VVILGLFLAVVLNGLKNLTLRGFFTSLYFIPFIVPLVAVAIFWLFLLQPNEIGLLNALFAQVGLPRQGWLSHSSTALLSLAIVGVWRHIGYAMVLFSAAIKSVPTELLEAARIDGANDFRIFFDIMIPQIWGTLIVVWTTITITVLKVFDIVYAMTNGEFQTQVLANFMYRWMFISGDYGRGSTIAVILMLAVVPIMVWNIRRANAEEGTR